MKTFISIVVGLLLIILTLKLFFNISAKVFSEWRNKIPYTEYSCFIYEKIVDKSEDGWKYYVLLGVEEKKVKVQVKRKDFDGMKEGETKYFRLSRNQIENREPDYSGVGKNLIFLIILVIIGINTSSAM